MNENVTAKVIAKGMYQGKPLTVEVRRYGDGYEYVDTSDISLEDQTKRLTIVMNGKEFIIEFGQYAILCGKDFITTVDDDDYPYIGRLLQCIEDRYEKSRKHYVYRASPKCIEAYWLAFNYGDGFDEVPEITVEGEIDTLGAPFSDEDTSGVVF